MPDAHELGRVFRHAGTKGRRDHAFATCACGVTIVGRRATDVLAQHDRHVELELERHADRPHRTDPRWVRLRAACCEIVGSTVNDQTLDEYVDVIYSRLMPGNDKGRRRRSPWRGQRDAGGREV